MPQGYDGLPPYYTGSSDPITPKLGLSLKGMDPIVAEDFVIIDTAFGGLNTTIKVNGSVVNNPNFKNSASSTFTVVGSDITVTVVSAGETWSGLTGVLTNGQVIPYADAGFSRLGAGSLAFGNGTNGDTSGTLTGGKIKVGPTAPNVAINGYGVSSCLSPTSDLGAPFTTFAAFDGELTVTAAVNSLVNWAAAWLYSSLAGTKNYIGGTGLDVTMSCDTSGSVTGAAYGINTAAKNSTGTVNALYGILSLGESDGGSVASLYAGDFEIIFTGTGHATTAYGLAVEQPGFFGSAGATHYYGLWIDDPTVGGALNPDPWAIFVVAGKSHFGGTVSANPGFQVNGAATSGHVLRGNGTNFVDAALVLTDLPSGIASTLAVHQVAHGFTVGQAVYFTGTVWSLAESNAIGTLGLGLVIVVVGANDFIVCFEGPVTGLSGLTAGQYYFVSDATPGALTITEPVATSSFSNPLLFAISTTTGTVLAHRPSSIGSTVITPTFTVVTVTSNANAVAGQLILVNTGTGGFTVTLPLSSANTGQIITIKKVSTDGNTVTIGRTGSDLIDGQTLQSFTLAYTAVSLSADGAGNWFVI